MKSQRRRLGRRLGALAGCGLGQAAGALVTVILKAIRHVDRTWISDVFARLMRKVGPWRREHRIGRANLAAAFPEKSPAEIEQILLGVWDNLGRVAAEFAHLDRLWDYDPTGRRAARVTDSDADRARFHRLRDKRALIFAAHLGN